LMRPACRGGRWGRGPRARQKNQNRQDGPAREDLWQTGAVAHHALALSAPSAQRQAIERRYGRPVATVTLSYQMDCVTGEPSPMYGAMTSWLNCIVAFAPVRSRTLCRSSTGWPSNQY